MSLYQPCEDAPCCGCCGTNIYGVNQDAEVCYLGHEDCYDNHTPERLRDEADWKEEV